MSDAIDGYAARAADKAAGLTPAERQAAADKEMQHVRDESADGQTRIFEGMVRARIDNLRHEAGTNFPEVRDVSSGGGSRPGTDLRLSWSVTYALCPDGDYSGRDTLTFSADPINDIATAYMPAPIVNNSIGSPIVLGTSAFQSAQVDWIDAMLALWLDRAQP